MNDFESAIEENANKITQLMGQFINVFLQKRNSILWHDVIFPVDEHKLALDKTSYASSYGGQLQSVITAYLKARPNLNRESCGRRNQNHVLQR